MIIKFGKTKRELLEKLQRLSNWHTKFAWFPIKIEEGRYVWLTNVTLRYNIGFNCAQAKLKYYEELKNYTSIRPLLKDYTPKNLEDMFEWWKLKIFSRDYGDYNREVLLDNL